MTVHSVRTMNKAVLGSDCGVVVDHCQQVTLLSAVVVFIVGFVGFIHVGAIPYISFRLGLAIRLIRHSLMIFSIDALKVGVRGLFGKHDVVSVS